MAVADRGLSSRLLLLEKFPIKRMPFTQYDLEKAHILFIQHVRLHRVFQKFSIMSTNKHM